MLAWLISTSKTFINLAIAKTVAIKHHNNIENVSIYVHDPRLNINHEDADNNDRADDLQS